MLLAPTITALDCGWLRTQMGGLSDGGSTDEISLPVPAWLVQHQLGTVVFDVGLHPDLADGPEPLGRLAKLFTPELEAGGTVGHRLAEHGVDPLGKLTVVLSHCHFDHTGGLCELPNARVIIQTDEWIAATGADDVAYDKSLYMLGHDVLTIAGAHDLFGDGTVACIPTPGHTCGHQSLRVVTANGPVILTADACYFSHTLDDGVLPPFAYDFDQQRASLDMLRREHAGGTAIVPGHDADVLRRLLATPL
jgi:glyoxylase-like metal-dependent hydrolase (beta-lactamase superfamily II)